ncbi:MAG: MBL fold metallo-hydrolase [Thiohalomonadales bacterium]
MGKIYFVFILLLSFAVNIYADTIEPSNRVTSRLKVKEAPSSQSSVVMYLYPGQQLPLLSKENRYYYKVQLPNNNSGWVSKSWSRIVSSSSQNNNLAITFFNVGQGDSALIVCPNGHNILIDAGSTSGVKADVIRNQLLNALKDQNRQIHTLIITHPDADHYNRLPLVLQDINVDQVFLVGEQNDYYKYFWNWFSALNSKKKFLSQTDINKPGTPNSDINCGSAQAFILSANEQSNFSSKNTASIVLMIRYKDFESIFTGDATRVTEKAIINRYPASWLDVDLLKIGHHGSLTTSTTTDWSLILSPEIAVVSVGNNRYGHPRTEVLQRLEIYTVSANPHPMKSATRPDKKYVYEFNNSYTEAIYSTQVSGSIQVISDGTNWRLQQ